MHRAILNRQSTLRKALQKAALKKCSCIRLTKGVAEFQERIGTLLLLGLVYTAQCVSHVLKPMERCLTVWKVCLVAKPGAVKQLLLELQSLLPPDLRYQHAQSQLSITPAVLLLEQYIPQQAIFSHYFEPWTGTLGQIGLACEIHTTGTTVRALHSARVHNQAPPCASGHRECSSPETPSSCRRMHFMSRNTQPGGRVALSGSAIPWHRMRCDSKRRGHGPGG